ncbi:GNAT family N-acetyltransferase, partial [Tessaracoccus sp. SD287]|uniref:GNAT family N-acetyltransferase n=1 Tax=Tessaracoccus sp. SD287 TaxID=2782008 RepID=UPI001A96B84A
DIDDLVEVNALAFADHPEQGRMSRQDVLDKMAEDWFDAEGLFLARDADGRLLGYHWTKIEGDVGEVYVIGVHPFEHGRGLGRYLLAIGLHHLSAARGARVIDLYVEAANERVVTMYENAGFVEVQRDTRWA